jgi:hypothetical protein
MFMTLYFHILKSQNDHSAYDFQNFTFYHEFEDLSCENKKWNSTVVRMWHTKRWLNMLTWMQKSKVNQILTF